MDPLLWPVQPTHLLIGIENMASVAATALVVQCLWDVSDTIMATDFVVWWSYLSAGFHQDFELGDGSRMIVACETRCTRGVWGHTPPPLPQENFEFTSSQITFDTIWDKISKQHFDDTCLCSVTCKTNITRKCRTLWGRA